MSVPVGSATDSDEQNIAIPARNFVIVRRESNLNDASLHLHQASIPEDSTLTALGPTCSDEQHMVILARI